MRIFCAPCVLDKDTEKTFLDRAIVEYSSLLYFHFLTFLSGPFLYTRREVYSSVENDSGYRTSDNRCCISLDLTE